MRNHAPARRAGLLFDYEWDAQAHAAMGRAWQFDRAGFDLFSFPSNARLIGFDLERFAAQQVSRARQRGWGELMGPACAPDDAAA